MRLASQLTGWDIDILTEAEESERRQKEFAERSNMFMESLDVDETVAQLLSSEGFTSVEDLAFVPADELAGIEGFDAETAEELQNRAKDYLDRIEKELDDKRKALGVKDELAEVPGVTTKMMVALGENDVKTVEEPRRLRHRRSDRLDRAQGRRSAASRRLPRGLRPRPRSRGNIDHAGTRQGGWIDAAELAPAEAEEAEAAEAQS